MKKFLVSRSDWHAEQAMKSIAKGVLDKKKILYDKYGCALRKLQSLPLGKQELYSIYQVDHD